MAILGAYVVLYIVNNELAKEILARAVDYLNRPLPIIGVSTVVVAVLGYKIFTATVYGKTNLAKQKAQFESEKEELKTEFEKQKTEYVSVIKSYQGEIDLIYNSVIEMCDSNPNLKIKIIGEKLKNEIADKKNALREAFNLLVNSNADLLASSKEEIANEIVERLQKDLEAKYGEQGKEIFNSIPKEKKL